MSKFYGNNLMLRLSINPLVLIAQAAMNRQLRTIGRAHDDLCSHPKDNSKNYINIINSIINLSPFNYKELKNNEAVLDAVKSYYRKLFEIITDFDNTIYIMKIFLHNGDILDYKAIDEYLEKYKYLKLNNDFEFSKPNMLSSEQHCILKDKLDKKNFFTITNILDKNKTDQITNYLELIPKDILNEIASYLHYNDIILTGEIEALIK